MTRFTQIAAAALIALQPLAASAAQFQAPMFHSPTLIRQQYRQQEQMRLAQHVHSARQQTYAKVGDYTPALPASGLSIGSVTAPVTIVEFIDYACPHCAGFETQIMPMLKSQYVNTGKVRFVVRNFPLSYHAAANVAAQAVECARRQKESFGWTLHDALLTVTAADNDLTQNDVYAAFQKLPGIDTEAMYYCIDTKATQARITQDEQDGVNGGVNGTPSFWVLGQHGKAELIQGAVSFATFQKVIAGMQQ